MSTDAKTGDFVAQASSLVHGTRHQRGRLCYEGSGPASWRKVAGRGTWSHSRTRDDYAAANAVDATAGRHFVPTCIDSGFFEGRVGHRPLRANVRRMMPCSSGNAACRPFL